MKNFKFLLVLMLSLATCSVSFAQLSTKNLMVQEVYNSQVGVKELTGKNDGKQVEGYLKTVGLSKGYPWCAAFVRWTYNKADVPTTINAMALSVDRKNNRVFYKGTFYSEPQIGDAFTLYYPHLRRIGHTGFYDGRQNTSIYKTVEGNTNSAGSREGDGVYRKYRSFKATHSINKWISTSSSPSVGKIIQMRQYRLVA